MKRLEVIQATRRGHECSAPGCGKRILGRMPAIALVDEEVINGKTEKSIAWFCSIDCYNAFECGLIYAGGACCEDPGGSGG